MTSIEPFRGRESASKCLFICTENACRSQMAEAYFNHYSRKNGLSHIASSAGTTPGPNVNPLAISVMTEVGLDISTCSPKAVCLFEFDNFDLFITMGCLTGCPVTPQERTIEWYIEDPKGKDIGTFRKVRDQIDGKVKQLLGIGP